MSCCQRSVITSVNDNSWYPPASNLKYHHWRFLKREDLSVVEGKVAQLCSTLCDPMGCSLPGSSVHGIFQARILEWVAISFSNKWIKLLSIGEKDPQHCKSLICPNSNDTIEKNEKECWLKSTQTWWPRLMSHPWNLSRLGSQGWSVLDLRVLGRYAWQWAVYWRTRRISSSGGVGRSSCSQAKPTEPKGCWNIWDGRALKSPLSYKTPGGWHPNSSLLPWSHPTSRWHHCPQSRVAGISMYLGNKG